MRIQTDKSYSIRKPYSRPRVDKSPKELSPDDDLSATMNKMSVSSRGTSDSPSNSASNPSQNTATPSGSTTIASQPYNMSGRKKKSTASADRERSEMDESTVYSRLHKKTTRVYKVWSVVRITRNGAILPSRPPPDDFDPVLWAGRIVENYVYERSGATLLTRYMAKNARARPSKDNDHLPDDSDRCPKVVLPEGISQADVVPYIRDILKERGIIEDRIGSSSRPKPSASEQAEQTRLNAQKDQLCRDMDEEDMYEDVRAMQRMSRLAASKRPLSAPAVPMSSLQREEPLVVPQAQVGANLSSSTTPYVLAEAQLYAPSAGQPINVFYHQQEEAPVATDVGQVDIQVGSLDVQTATPADSVDISLGQFDAQLNLSGDAEQQTLEVPPMEVPQVTQQYHIESQNTPTSGLARDEPSFPPPPQDENQPPSSSQQPTSLLQEATISPNSFGGDRAYEVPQPQIGSSASEATSSPTTTNLPPTLLSRISAPRVIEGQSMGSEEDRPNALNQAAQLPPFVADSQQYTPQPAFVAPQAIYQQPSTPRLVPTAPSSPAATRPSTPTSTSTPANPPVAGERVYNALFDPNSTPEQRQQYSHDEIRAAFRAQFVVPYPPPAPAQSVPVTTQAMEPEVCGMEVDDDAWAHWAAIASQQQPEDDAMDVDDDVEMEDGAQIANDTPQKPLSSTAFSWVPINNDAQKDQSTRTADTKTSWAPWAQTTPAQQAQPQQALPELPQTQLPQHHPQPTQPQQFQPQQAQPQPVHMEDRTKPRVQITNGAQLPLQQQQPSIDIQQSWVQTNNGAQNSTQQVQPQFFANSLNTNQSPSVVPVDINQLHSLMQQAQHQQYVQQQVNRSPSQPFSPFLSATHQLDAARSMGQQSFIDPTTAACNFWSVMEQAVNAQHVLTPPPAPIVVSLPSQEELETRRRQEAENRSLNHSIDVRAAIAHSTSRPAVRLLDARSPKYAGRRISPLPKRVSTFASSTSIFPVRTSVFESDDARQASLRLRLADEAARQERAAHNNTCDSAAIDEVTPSQPKPEKKRKRTKSQRDESQTQSAEPAEDDQLCDACDERLAKRARRVDFDEVPEVFIIDDRTPSPARPVVPARRSALKKVCKQKKSCKELRKKEEEAREEKETREAECAAMQARREWMEIEAEMTVVVESSSHPNPSAPPKPKQSKQSQRVCYGLFGVISKFFGIS